MAENREAEVSQAKLAEQAERYDDMAAAMKRSQLSFVAMPMENSQTKSVTFCQLPTRMLLVPADRHGVSFLPSSRSLRATRPGPSRPRSTGSQLSKN